MIVFFILFFLVGCGSQQPSFLKSFEKEGRLVVFAMGGRSSCGRDNDPRSMSMYPRVEQFIDRLRESFFVQTITTCYDRYGGLFAQIAEDKPQKTTPETVPSFSDGLTKDHVVLVGHSYGGWLAMRTALALKSHVDLVTIDAISPVECQLTAPTSWLGCQRAPKDISSQEVGATTRRWQHFFQTSTVYLHSSEIPEANNEHVPNVGHTQIDDQPHVWAKIGV